MQKQMLIVTVVALGLGVTGCEDRQPEEGVTAVEKTVSTGELHNEVLTAFNQRVELSSVPGLEWEEWLESALASMEEVSAARGLPFDRDVATAEIVGLTKVFHELEKATGISPGMLRESTTPEKDFAAIVAQLETWKLLAPDKAQALSQFKVDSADESAHAATDPDVREFFELGAYSAVFWKGAAKQPGAQVAAPTDGLHCRGCFGSVLSDMLGAVIGRIVCGNDPLCPMRTSAAASILFNMSTGYCDTHPCDWQPWLPPIVLP